MEEETEEGGGIWLSIGDMMSGLLMLFVLLFLTSLLKLQTMKEEVQSKKEEVDKYIKELEQALERKESQRIMIIKALTDALQDANIEATLDTETGDLSISNEILFSQGNASLQDGGKAFLKTFIPVYSQVIYSDPNIESEISRVIIEGYTSSEGMETTNFRLSLERSYSVIEYILLELDFPNKDKFVSILQPSGRGEVEADKTMIVDSDRKVMFRFKFAGENFETIAKDLERIRLKD